MKYLSIVLTLAVVMIFYAACQKNETATPAAKTTVKPDSTVSVPDTFTPHTDTFYGIYNYNCYGQIGDSATYVYVCFVSPDTITFTSAIISAISEGTCPGFNLNFQSSHGNIYTNGIGANDPYTFTLRNDSLIYNGVFVYDCPDAYLYSFAGAKK